MGNQKEKMGTMKKIYILHGWTYSLEKWDEFAKLLRQNGFDPVFLKIPGLTSESDEVWDLDKYSEWLGRELSKINGKVILLGHSNGGRIAVYFTAKHSGKVQNLILMDAAGIYHKELALQVKRFIFGSIVKIGKKFTSSETLKNLLYYLAGERDYQKASPNMKLSMVNLTHHDLTPFLSKIRVPTLVIWGQNDTVTSISDGKLMAKLIEGSKLIIIRGARHSPFYTHPAEVAQIIKNDI
jgi:pimeloyl-ACP methyl ester carboxylesterase